MPEDKLPNIIALIPAYNEQDHLGQIVAGAGKYLPVLVVDDGSTDRTGSVAEAGGAILVRQIPNQGKGAALRAGFRYAIEHDYSGVLTLDADGQHDPQEIPAFLAAYGQDQPDLIIGARNFSHIPAMRRLANTLGQWSFSWALGEPIPDNQSGYRLISRRLLEAVLSSQESGFEFEVEMIVTCVERGYRLAWVPIRTIYAGEKSHIQPVHHVVNYLRIIWQTRRRRQNVGQSCGADHNPKDMG
jgi:glycosyltransferase involved in cell wall biosynthesis